jgi:DNA polymerase-3 subunit epsilon
MIADYKTLSDNDFLVLDTETTGLENDDQVVEVSIIDSQDNTLMNVRCRPTTSINAFALNVHGLSEEVLKNEPQFVEYYDELKHF